MADETKTPATTTAATKPAATEKPKAKAEKLTYEQQVEKQLEAQEKREKESRVAANKERADALLRQTGNVSADPKAIKARVAGTETKEATASGDE